MGMLRTESRLVAMTRGIKHVYKKSQRTMQQTLGLNKTSTSGDKPHAFLWSRLEKDTGLLDRRAKEKNEG